MHIMHIVGARPNFMKAAPLVRALLPGGARQTLVHSGQHFDASMSDIFFDQLGIPAPDVNLAVGSGSHAQQTAEIMQRLEPVVLQRKPDLMVVYGDVNSTVAAAIVCSKLLVPIAHVEAGLRSFDRTMPEEINRLLTDQISDLLFTPSPDADENLKREGIAPEKIHMVGNIMIDTLVSLLPAAARSVPDDLPPRYILVTLHRPGNVDDEQFMQDILRTLEEISRKIPVIFPVHPRTRQRMAGLEGLHGGVVLMPPQSYLSFLALQQRARVVVTDSGGIQEETTFLGVPCLTVRENTERPVTVTAGSNILVGRDMNRLRSELEIILQTGGKPCSVPELWDGHTAERIAAIIGQSRRKHPAGAKNSRGTSG